MKFFYIAVVIGGGVALGNYWFSNRPDFPYSDSKADIQITLDESTLNKAQRSFYEIKAGAIDGKATFTSVSTFSLGQSIMNSQIFGIKSTFESTTAPYPGFITQVIACETKKYVKEQNIVFSGKASKMILAVVSNRRLFGICSLDEIKYTSLFWTGYDEKRKQVVTIELFNPVTDISKINESQNEIIQIFNKIINRS